MSNQKADGSKKTWVRGQVDSKTHEALSTIKLRLNARDNDGIRIEDIAMECIKLGWPLYKKKMGV